MAMIHMHPVSADKKIKTVRQAVSRLGVKQTQSLVATISNKNMYKAKHDMIMAIFEKLWVHSLATAHSSKEIAAKLLL